MADTITDEQRAIAGYIEQTWPGRFHVELSIRLSQIFPEPENKGLKHIWKYGEADIVVYREKKPVAIIEPGGAHHFEEKQSLNDRRKWKLTEQNGVRCLTMMNGLQTRLSKRKWRALLGRYLFGTPTETSELATRSAVPTRQPFG